MQSFKQYLTENDDGPIELHIPLSADPTRSIATLLGALSDRFKIIYTDPNGFDVDSPVEGPPDDIIITDEPDIIY